MEWKTREAMTRDIPWITEIYNQGIEDRVATFETDLRTVAVMEDWLSDRGERFKVVIIEEEEGIPRGWASINAFQSRCCYGGVGDLSIYIHRDFRGKGLGKVLLMNLIETAKEQGFHKLVLSMFDFNEAAKKLYLAQGFRMVGTYKNQGMLDGNYVDVTIMEKLF
ncbi:MAG: arsinothricin resistance N-acetyltransferase ArsN1 family A [Bacillota bacterium]